MSQPIFIHDMLDYNMKDMPYAGAEQFYEFENVGGGSFRSGRQVNFQIGSAHNYVKPDTMLVKYDLKLIGGATDAITEISSVGAPAVIQSARYILGGREVENNDAYNHWCSVNYKKYSPSGKALIKQLQLTGSPKELSDSAGKLTTGRTICHPLLGFVTSNTAIPLPYVTAGLRVELRLADFKTLMADNNGAHTDYEISNVRIFAQLIKPTAEFVAAANNTIAAGKHLKIQFMKTTHNQVKLTTALTQNITIPCGKLASIRALTGTIRDTAVTESADLDAFDADNTTKLKSWRIRINQDTYPDFPVGMNNSVNDGPVDPTQLAISAVLAGSSQTQQFNADTDMVLNTANYIHYSWGNEFKQGHACSPGYIQLELVFFSAPTDGQLLDVWLEHDSEVHVSSRGVDQVENLD